MATAAEDLIQQAGSMGAQTVQGQGQVAGDALNAYQIVQKAQQAREQFEMDKQTHQENLFNWSAKSLDDITAAPEGHIRNTLINQYADSAQKLYPGFNRDNIDVFKHDDDSLRAAQIASSKYQADPSAPEAQQWLQAIHTGGTSDMIKQNLQITQAHEAGLAQVAKANMMVAPRMAASQLSANNQYSQQIGKTENAIYSADRATGLIDKMDSGELKSTKTIAADLNSATASLLAQGRPSTVYGQQATHADDLYERTANAIQFLTANPQDTQAPAKLDQLKKDIHALRDFYSDQHSQQYESFREGMPDQFKPSLDKRYNKFRASHNLGASADDAAPQTGQSSPSGSLPGTSKGADTSYPEIGPHGMSVMQNNHTYNWNSKTGQYE